MIPTMTPREFINTHDLTVDKFAQVTGLNLETVRHWLASPTAKRYSPHPEYIGFYLGLLHEKLANQK